MKELIAYLEDTYDISLSKSGNIKLNNSIHYKVSTIVTQMSTYQVAKKYGLENILESSDIEIQVNKAIREIAKDIERKKYDAINNKGAPEFQPSAVVLGIDALRGDTYILNKDLERLGVNVDAWKIFYGSEAYGSLDKILCHLKYRPLSLSKVLGSEGEIKIINTCVHPKWRYENLSEPKELKPIFKRFLTDFFATPESLSYSMSWIKTALLDRNETALVMVGAKGIGKNIFCSIFNRLFGSINVSNQANNAYQEKFNGFLKDTRIVIADEVSFKDGAEKNRVKKYFNRIQSVETKGKDAESIEVHASMVMLSNNVRDLFIEADDRRFSCVDLTETPLLKSMTSEEIQELASYIESDSDFPIAFYQFMEQNLDESFVNAIPFKGATYQELVISSLTGIQRAIHDKATSGEVVKGFHLKDIDFDWSQLKRKPSLTYFKDFLKNHTVEGERLGVIVSANRTEEYYIEVNEKFRAKSNPEQL